MIPNSSILTEQITETQYPSDTYKVDVSSDINYRINGFIDDEIEAIDQAIYLILNTEKYQHIIYSWTYGVELLDLVGKPISYVMSEVQRRVREALMHDNRIMDVVDFEFERKGKILEVTFTVITNVGNFERELEVNV